LSTTIFKGVVYVYIITATLAREPPPPSIKARTRAQGIKGEFYQGAIFILDWVWIPRYSFQGDSFVGFSLRVTNSLPIRLTPLVCYPTLRLDYTILN